MKIGSYEIGRKAYKKRTPTTFKSIGAWALRTSISILGYATATMIDPVYFKLASLYLPMKYTICIALGLLLVKAATSYIARADEIPIYPAPPELIKDENVVAPKEIDNL